MLLRLALRIPKLVDVGSTMVEAGMQSSTLVSDANDVIEDCFAKTIDGLCVMWVIAEDRPREAGFESRPDVESLASDPSNSKLDSCTFGEFPVDDIALEPCSCGEDGLKGIMDPFNVCIFSSAVCDLKSLECEESAMATKMKT
jgi:hypothetical protein